MDPYLVILLEGLLFIVAFGGLTQIRREGLTTRFMLESVGVTLVAVLAMVLTGQPIHPLAFLIVIYLITMRVRLVIDAANVVGQSGRGRIALRLYSLAEMLGPDPSGQVLIAINRATLLMNAGQTDAAIPFLEDVLERAVPLHLGFKHEAAARYNLGMAYMRAGREGAGVEKLNEVIDLWPGSRYARRAAQALDERSTEHAARTRGDQPSHS